MSGLIPRLRKWLGDDGITFFREVKKNHGEIGTAVWTEPGCLCDEDPCPLHPQIPHAVHFWEGMQVRNWLRDQPECQGWTDHDYDDRWAELVTEAIQEPEPPKKRGFEFL